MAIKRGNSTDSFEEQENCDAVWYQQQIRTLQGTIDLLEGELEGMRQQQRAVYAVSYTHLTLPTIYSV